MTPPSASPLAPPSPHRLREAWRAAAPAVRRLLVRMVGAGEADDLLQDVFERALVAPPDDLAVPSLARWLLHVARNAAIDRIRARAVRERAADDPAGIAPTGEGAPPPDVALQRKQVCACIASLVGRLPAPQRTVLELAELQGLSDQATADRLGVSLGSAKIRLHRARRALRSVMGTECRTYRDDRNELSCEPVQRDGR